MPTRVAIFDDSRDRRESLRYLLGMFDDLVCVGDFVDASKAVQHVAHSRPDVVLMDIEMPNVNGIEGTLAIKAEFPHINVIMQTVFEDDDSLFSSIKAGACGYILKRDEPAKVIEAIRDAMNGGASINPSMALRVLRYFKDEEVARPELNANYGLTDRENQILSMLVDGLSYKMIADRSAISFHTVNSHIRKIYDKLHVHSMSEAVSKALKEKLV